MNKKLIALLVALAVAPFGQTFAADDKAWKDTGYVGQALVRAGITTHAEYNEGSRSKLDIGLVTVPAAVLAGVVSYLGYRGYQNSEMVWEVIKACLTFNMEVLSKYWENDKALVITTITGLAAAGCIATRSVMWMVNYFTSGVDYKALTAKYSDEKTTGEEKAEIASKIGNKADYDKWAKDKKDVPKYDDIIAHKKEVEKEEDGEKDGKEAV